ncbi:NAD(P)H-quinone oxidoreductase subunit I, chloroplastic [Austwickia sp. TVS 96-490-7B]|uniref:4Fe-4S binding protein n=1 Tax=Austwickia sp. TVS 96-490-7B TaxID=2830843 RepID=UPI001C5931D3|nr:4Fe-4S binding protein [Austwickia sp. TVS 96-490-7B]MBW3085684.1 NAD(P)H-quinone oxidoreductase subunit I, chloroplastic [Austwickia sp. TVS 96-490-7B]
MNVASPAGIPARSRGAIALDPQACTACMLCARECPDWCITLGSRTEEIPPDPAASRGRTRVVHRLEYFEIDFGLCLFCGICVDVCPFDALSWTPTPVPSGRVASVTAGADVLDNFRRDIPPETSLEVGAMPPRPKDSGRGHGGGRRAR